MIQSRILFSITMMVTLSAALLQAQESEGFRRDGGMLRSQASAEGLSKDAALKAARSTALNAFFQGIKADWLFRDIFLKDPPLDMEFKTIKVEKRALGVFTLVELEVLEESIRLIRALRYEPRLTEILDMAEISLSAARTDLREAASAESDGDLPRAAAAYWRSADALREASRSLEGLVDLTILASKSRRSLADIQADAQGLTTQAADGLNRTERAAKELEADKTQAAIAHFAAELEKRMPSFEANVREFESKARSAEGRDKDSLRLDRDAASSRLGEIKVERSNLIRNKKLLGGAKSLLAERLSYLEKRLASYESSMKKSRARIAREMSASAQERARRSAALKWFFFHKPSDYLALRISPPLGLFVSPTGTKMAGTGLFDASLRAEAAFLLGRSWGLWTHTSLGQEYLLLSQGSNDTSANAALSQEAELGLVLGGMVYGLNYGWDWLRFLDNDAIGRESSFSLVIGAMEASGKQPLWLGSLGLCLPPADSGTALPFHAYLNPRADFSLKLGSLARLEAEFERRILRSGPGQEELSAVFHYGFGAGIRLPQAFLWGMSLDGYVQDPLTEGLETKNSTFLRFFIEYAL